MSEYNKFIVSRDAFFLDSSQHFSISQQTEMTRLKEDEPDIDGKERLDLPFFDLRRIADDLLHRWKVAISNWNAKHKA